MCRSLIIFGAMVASVFLCFLPEAHADVYKWRDANGKLHFSDVKPESERVETLRFKEEKTSSAAATEPVSFQQKQPEAVPDNAPEVEQPANVVTKKVVLYSASWCGYCKQARQFFMANSIPFHEYDIEASSKGKHDYERMHGKAVPIILVGKKKLQGFNSEHFMSLYQEK